MFWMMDSCPLMFCTSSSGWESLRRHRFLSLLVFWNVEFLDVSTGSRCLREKWRVFFVILPETHSSHLNIGKKGPKKDMSGFRECIKSWDTWCWLLVMLQGYVPVLALLFLPPRFCMQPFFPSSKKQVARAARTHRVANHHHPEL